MITEASDRLILHATTVAVEGHGLLILGPSGSGKSSLALQMIALGGLLVADDRSEITLREGKLLAACPAPALTGRIEARGVGILAVRACASVPLHLAVDLGQAETQRLPPRRQVTLLGTPLDLVLGSQADHLPAALLCYLKGGRTE